MNNHIPCGACGLEMLATGGRAVITAAGVQVLCANCLTPDSEPPTDTAAPVDTPRRPQPTWPRLAVAACVLLFVASPTRTPLTAPVAALAGHGAADAEVLAGTDVRARAKETALLHELTFQGDTRLKPSSWVHPLPGPERLLPKKRDRQFGARRSREARPECGGGHCGVDLGGVIGTPIHAIRGGVVTRIVRDPLRESGNYVRLAHNGGFISYYMHLDDVSDDIYVGQVIDRGTVLGTLGDSGIADSPPHLHFAVSRRVGQAQRYVDPEPMLRKATLLPRAPRGALALRRP